MMFLRAVTERVTGLLADGSAWPGFAGGVGAADAGCVIAAGVDIKVEGRIGAGPEGRTQIGCITGGEGTGPGTEMEEGGNKAAEDCVEMSD